MATVKVSGMKSPDCAATITDVVKTADGVEVVSVNYATGEVTYGSTECVDPAMVEEMLKEAGYEPEEN
ncbi:heavy metal-associated domain-containing protein [Halodesulfovibrio sp.]|jgi:copper chaperone CopZ|uniref:heavy-metal-associated domain-containing protein n=1 Tax=Halodesulfovibrio sp. TaxID=1912772 RepID=UPI0025EC74B9|nr:heavy metal-associated domain-containing protein [Halodesulfovibrio sp.]MCT4536084.1 heavy-metal-associated domain-containing protein [Halodesulfovibrio sp.]